VSERLARTVECRFFGGMSEEETAEALRVSDRTVRRDWIKAKAWLYAELSDGAKP
jgi:DNA-directed RNA polymerase specialized sigma24 family protein